MIQQFRWRIERVRDLYRKRGLGIWCERGSTGTTYDEPGRNMFLTVEVLLFVAQFALRFGWKDVPREVADTKRPAEKA